MAWTFLYAASHQIFDPKFSVAGFLSHTKTFHDVYTVFTTPTVAPILTFLVSYGHLLIGLSLAVVYIGLRITNIDVSHSNPDFASRVISKLFQWDTSILTPQNEFETWWDTAEGLMVITIFLGIIATAFAIVIALPLSFLGARNIMTGNPVSAAVYLIVRLVFTVIRSIDVLILVIITAILLIGVVGMVLDQLLARAGRLVTFPE